MKTAFVLGRILFGGFFLYNGVNHFLQNKALSQYAASRGIPMPEAAVAASGVALLLGGSSIITGVQPRLGAAAITGFLAAVSPLMHDFWRHQDPNQRSNEMIHFSKNMALLGSALALMSLNQPWPAAVRNSQAPVPVH